MEDSTNNIILCSHGCGREAKYYFKTVKKWCCCNRAEKCPEVRRKNSERQKNSNKIPWNKGLTKEIDERVNKNATLMKITKQIKSSNKELIAWNKGLTKETDERVKKYSETMKISKKGKPNIKNRKPITLNKTFGKFYHQFKSRLYTSWKYPVLQRDNFTCRKCGSTRNLEVHHLVKYSKLFEIAIKNTNLDILHWKDWNISDIEILEKSLIELHTLDIGVTYCSKCHGEEDNDRRKFLGE